MDLEELLSTLETMAAIKRIALRDLDETNAYALVFQKGMPTWLNPPIVKCSTDMVQRFIYTGSYVHLDKPEMN